MNDLIITRFSEYINSFHIKNVRKIAIAVSGGADSLALTFLTAEWLKKFKGSKIIVALTVNHNLRKESASEAQKVHKLLSEHKIEHHILNWQHKERISSNIQHKARVARRELLTKWCVDNEIEHLLMAHTKNDLVETFFMNIFRGSGIYGLSSIPEKITVNNIEIIRPVLNFTKNELKNYLRTKNVVWIEDPSNKNEYFLRTKIRKLFSSSEMKTIFADEDLFLKRITTNIKNISRARGCIESIINEKEVELVEYYSDYLTINRFKFCKLHPEIAMNILSNCLIKISKEHIYKPRLNSLEKLYNFICSDSNSTKTLWKCKIKISKDIIYIQQEKE
ncbi:MAG: tRNA lysidine(34) synthetase TilS [Rickettsiales bacterium]|nr:tRNA lysidine(34) synthetase TilS [Rickettsiales bacterium]